MERLAGERDTARQKDFLVRLADALPEAEMPMRMGKWARAGHVQIEVHWSKAPMEPTRMARG